MSSSNYTAAEEYLYFVHFLVAWSKSKCRYVNDLSWNGAYQDADGRLMWDVICNTERMEQEVREVAASSGFVEIDDEAFAIKVRKGVVLGAALTPTLDLMSTTTLKELMQSRKFMTVSMFECCLEYLRE